MKKVFLVFLMLLILGLAATAGAQDRHHKGGNKRHNWSHSAYNQKSWHHTSYKSVNIKWHQHRTHYFHDRYLMTRIHDSDWLDRFRGLHPFRWHDRHGEGFWYQGRRITDAVFFYNNSDELVSIGFMHNGAFVFIRDDDNAFENRDSFFVSWWNSH